MKQGYARASGKRLIRTIIVDLVLLGVCLCVFAYFHHVRVPEYNAKALAAPTPSPAPSATPAVEATAQPDAANETASPSPEAADTGLLGGKYADRFTAGEIEQTENSYRSANVSVEMTKVVSGTDARPITYYVADIYLKDISSFRTAMAYDFEEQNPGDRKNVMTTLLLSQLTNAIVAISGDNFTFRSSGLIAVRNGVEWERSLPLDNDICVLYYDGTMETYPKSIKRDAVDAIYARNPYQIWTFGPQLLVDGQVPTGFATSSDNPLSAVGYYEPGHYCFILVDGRQKGYSFGMSLADLAQLFQSLGCTVAYNLDGGKTAVMTFAAELRSQPKDGSPRDTSDILYVGEPVAAAATTQP